MLKLILSLFEPIISSWNEAKEIDNAPCVDIICGKLDTYEEVCE